jgi:CheY-like chemotaxis protein
MKPKSILVIEDDELVCQIVQRVAGNLGAQATIAQNGRTALDVLASPDGKRFDAIVLDMILPRASGWDILDYMKNNSLLAKTPVVIISGAQISSEEKNRLTAGGNAFVDKRTFGMESFQKVLATYLGVSEGHNANQPPTPTSHPSEK